MATRRKTLVPAPADLEAGDAVIIETKYTPLKDLNLYYKNPRVGNVEKIAESLEANGQYKAITINVGTKTGRPNEIAAGNHTYLGARRLGWKNIYTSYIDVDESALVKIVLADNKTAEWGTYDDSLLAELAGSVPDLTGTGFDQTEVDTLVSGLSTTYDTSVDLEGLKAAMPSATTADRPKDPRREAYEGQEDDDSRAADASRGASRPKFDDDDDIDQVQPAAGAPSTAEVQVELQAILELKEEQLFNGRNFWQVPELREDMLLQEFPKNIQTWAGWEATPDDGKKWFFAQYGLGGTKGLPLDRTILAFNTHDDKFINWWEMPAYYTSKMITGGLRAAVVPDFSFYYSMPRFVHLQGVYRAQWLGRFMQEAGIKVIPRVQFDDEKSLEFCMLGIPKNPPYVECSVQNFGTDKESKKEDELNVIKLLQKCVDELEPTRGLIVYGGNPGKRVLEQIDTHGADHIWVENYAGVRRGTAFDKKKDGLKSLTKKEREAIRKKVRAEAGVSDDTGRSTGNASEEEQEE